MASQTAGSVAHAAVAISGGFVTATNIAGTINNYGASAAELEAIDSKLAAIIALLSVKEAARDDGTGVGRQTIVAVAQRLNPTELLDPQAIREVERGVDTARETIAFDGRNLDGGVQVVFALVADATARGDFDSGAEAIDAGLADLEAEYRESRIAMLQQAIRVDELRRDAAAVAQRIALLVAVNAPGAVPEWLPEYRDYYNFYGHEAIKNSDRSIIFGKEGFEKLRFPATVAVELARRMLRTARDARERRDAADIFGGMQSVVGVCDATPNRLIEAIDCYRHALDETDAVETPADWAMLQSGLGGALYGLALRERRTAGLHAARDACLAAASVYAAIGQWAEWAKTTLKIGSIEIWAGRLESSSDLLLSAVVNIGSAIARLPQDATQEWAETHASLSGAVHQLALHTPEPGWLFDLALAGYQAALDATPRDGCASSWADIQSELGNCYADRGRLTGDTRCFDKAITAFQTSLEVATREELPRQWMVVHSRYAFALFWRGNAETGTAGLEAAVAAYRAVLEVADRAAEPNLWANCSAQEGVALMGIAARRKDLSSALDGRTRIVAALRVARDNGDVDITEFCEKLLPTAAEIVARLGGPADLEEP